MIFTHLIKSLYSKLFYSDNARCSMHKPCTEKHVFYCQRQEMILHSDLVILLGKKESCPDSGLLPSCTSNARYHVACHTHAQTHKGTKPCRSIIAPRS